VGKKKQLFIGLMSGTSIDAIDSAILELGETTHSLIATHAHVIPEKMQRDIAALSERAPNEIPRMGKVDRLLGKLFAQATQAILDKASISAADITAIGSHGQTIRHHPPSAGEKTEAAFTLQIADPNTIAEITGITTVADFRKRDIAAGGEGAPLAPAFHAAVFSDPSVNRVILNIGGIANISVLEGEKLRTGFDTGPGNTLMDHWTWQHKHQAYDSNGDWAASGQVDEALLAQMLRHAYFSLPSPKSTGKEAFNATWLQEQLKQCQMPAPKDVQCTLAEFTARTIADAISNVGISIEAVYVCGGGAHNTHLMHRLKAHLGKSAVKTTECLGIHPDWVEAATFAWLAHRTLENLPGNSVAVTGAHAQRVLGGIYQA